MAGWGNMNSILTVEIVSASTAEMLTAVGCYGIKLWSVQELDTLTVRARVSKREYYLLKRLLKKRGERCKSVARYGLYWKFRSVLNRPVLVFGVLLMLLLSFYLPTRVLFVTVEGNQSVPEYQILEKAEACGIRMWASRGEVRSEKMKNRLLWAIPQLKWAGINTKGCTAIITVTERWTAPETDTTAGTKRIVAARDGVIEDITVTKGNSLCKVGQVVKKGQVLVSPYMDCGMAIKITDVEAEIMAVTNRKVCVKTMFPSAFKGQKTDESVSVSIVIGKNKINLYNGSGNCGGVCDKIYKEQYMMLPGSFQLPIGLVIERTIYRRTDSVDLTWQPDDSVVRSMAERYLLWDMVSGRILSEIVDLHPEEGGYVLNGVYSCLEMIGKLQDEEFDLNEQRS